MIDVEKFLIALRSHKDLDGLLKPIHLADTVQEEIKIIQAAVENSRREWVGLTEDECIGLLPVAGKEHMSKNTRWERSIETFSDEQLLFELVRRNGFQRAEKKTEYCGDGWVTSTVGIGKDHSVSITMDRDDFKELSVLAIVGFEAKLKEKNHG